MDQDSNDFAEAKGNDCKVIALQSQRGNADNQAGGGGGKPASDQHAYEKQRNAKKIWAAERPEQASTMFGREIRRDVCTDGHESGVTERKLPRISIDEIETDSERDVDADEDDDLQII